MSTFSNLRTRPSSASAVPLTQQQEPPRITPRNSDMEKQMAAGTTKETPYHTLRQLSNVIPRPTTPERRASSVGPPSTHASGRRTPAAQTRTPGAVQRLAGSARRVRPVTPHGRAAIRDIEARRAGLTPGKDRRRSGRQQRETPRDILRALSRTLAPTTQPIISSPQEFASTRRFTLPVRDDLDDGPELERPRLSLPFGDDDNEDDDDDDSLLLPPQTAGLEDENFTVRSVELPRRALSEQPGRLSRGSFGSIRLSDRFVDLNEIGSGGLDYDGVDSSYNLPGTFQADDIPDMGDTLGLQGENSGILRGFATDTSRISLASGRQSDIRPAVLTGDDTDTFAFTIPQQDPNGASLVFQEEESERHLDYNEAASENDDTTPELQAYSDSADVDVSMLDTSLQELDGIGQAGHKTARKKKIKISKHGIQYPSLPAGVVKKLATTFARTGGNSKAKLGKDALDAIQQASDWFFEQVSDDLGAYAKHAGRKTIDENDVIMLMTRQRQTNATTTPFSLAQKHLPRELLQELRMIPPPKSHRGRRLEVVEETNE